MCGSFTASFFDRAWIRIFLPGTAQDLFALLLRVQRTLFFCLNCVTVPWCGYVDEENVLYKLIQNNLQN